MPDSFRLAFEAPISYRKALDILPHGMRKPTFLALVELLIPLIEARDWDSLHKIGEGKVRLEFDDVTQDK